MNRRLLAWLESGLPAEQIALGRVVCSRWTCCYLFRQLLSPTYAGGVLPWGLAFLCAFTGLSAGHLIGFSCPEFWGVPLPERWAKPDDLKQLDQFSLKYGPVALIATRALPLLSEASVLLLGLTRLPIWLAATAIIMSNAVIAAGVRLCRCLVSGFSSIDLRHHRLGNRAFDTVMVDPKDWPSNSK